MLSTGLLSVLKGNSVVCFLSCREDTLDIEYGFLRCRCLLYSRCKVVDSLDGFVVDTLDAADGVSKRHLSLWSTASHLGTASLTVRGGGLFLRSYSETEAAVAGEIDCVEFGRRCDEAG